MTPSKERRKPNGRRIEGQNLVAKVAQEVRGKVLAQAFIIVKSAGFQLNVVKLDGVPRKPVLHSDLKETVNVDVVDGTVKKSWTS